MPRILALALAVIATIVVAGTGTALARRPRPRPAGRPVHIESQPPGATVYVNDKDKGPVGTTPLDTRLPPGEYTVIVELDGYVPAFETLIVEDLKGPKASHVTDLKVGLVPGVSILKVIGDAPPDARVLIDGKDRGGMPLRVEIEPGAHEIQVTMPGREPFEQWIELEGGQEHEVTVTRDDLPDAPPPPRRPQGPRRPLVIARLGSRAIWRHFTYQGATSDQYTAGFRPDPMVMVRLEAETAPWRRSGKAWPLWPLTLVLGGGITPSATATRAGESANYNQRELEAGLRYRLALGTRAAIGIDGGWQRLIYNFAGTLAYALPDVDYNVVRIGVRGEGHYRRAIGWIGVENRLVAGGGDLPGRFKAASADGFAVRAGLSARLWRGRLEVGTEYALVHFAWTFQPVDMAPMYVASGADDTFQGVDLWVGGAY